jgi:uncharacterized membrane protein
MPKLSIKLEQPPANIVPFVKGEIISEVIETPKTHRHISDSQKMAIVLLSIFIVFAAALVLLPWVFKFCLILSVYITIMAISHGGTGGTTPNVRARKTPGNSIVPRR